MKVLLAPRLNMRVLWLAVWGGHLVCMREAGALLSLQYGHSVCVEFSAMIEIYVVCTQRSHPVELRSSEQPEVNHIGLEQQTGFPSVFLGG